MKRIVLILTFLLISFQSIAQTFPVQLTPQVTPPYPVYISDYANTNSVLDKVRLQVVLNDITVNANQIRLKLYIQGEGILAESNDLVIGATPIFLEGGIPLQLGTNELAAYFEFQNLQGITPNTYGSALSEGIYQICFEAYDNMTNNVLSDKTCTTIVLFQNDPPLLNLPYNESVIEEQNPLNIVFQWTPRHINVSNVQYEFNLVEIWDNYVDPQAAFLSTPPIFQTTLSETTLIYGPAFPQLITGKKYAWNVRAFALDGAEEIGVFSNQGNSEIFWFTFQTPCDVPLFPEVEELSDHHAKLIWQGNESAHIDFTVKYREKDAGSDWYELTTPREYITISDLNLETTYEYKIIGNCDYGSFGETIIYEFTTLSEQASAYIGCNIEPDPADLSNQSLLPELYINDIIIAGDFPVTVLILDQASTPFSGKGYAVVPWLADTKLKVEFTSIQVNTDMQLISGEIKTTYDANWGNVDFIDEAFEIFEGDNDITEVDVPFDIEAGDISVNDNGEIVINNPNSNVEITYPAGDDYVITDASGDVFYVDEEGNVTEGGEIAEGGPVDTSNMPGFSNGNITQLSADGIKVIFNNDPSYTYGFDIIPDNERTKLNSFYDTITDAEGNSYDIAHKAVKNGGTDTIKGLIETTNDSLVSRLEFKTVQGVEIPHTIVGNEVTLDLSGHYSYENESIYASLLPEQDGEQQTIAGVFTLWHLSQKDINLTIVEVNGASAPSNITSSLNDIFGKAAVNFNVNTTAFNVDSSLYGGDTLLVGDSGILANYTNEERDIINSFKSQQYDANQYYLFVFGNDIQPSRSIAGFMPLKRQFGFIFSNSNATEEGKDSVAKVMAHELGHGIFGLEHPFKQFETTQGATDWLMDYSNGSSLNHMEWAQIHNPGFQLYLFQGDEEGEYSHAYLVSKIIQELKCKYKNNDYTVDSDLEGYIQNAMWYNPNSDVEESKEYSITMLKSTGGTFETINAKVQIGLKNSVSTLSQAPISYQLKHKVYGQVYEYDLGRVIIWSDYDLKTGSQGEEFIQKITTESHSIIDVYAENEPEGENQENIQSYDLEEVIVIAQSLNGFITSLVSDNHISNKDFKIIKSIASCDATSLSFDTRFKIIKLISEQWIINEKKEDLVLDLFKTTSPNDYDALLDKFKLNPIVFNNISSGMHDWIEGPEDNETRLYNELFTIWSNSSYYSTYHASSGSSYDINDRNEEFYREVKIEIEYFIFEGFNSECINQFTTATVPEICECLSTLPTTQIQQISYTDRKFLIEKILTYVPTYTATDGLSGYYERPIIRLIKYIPEDFDNDLFINYLVTQSITYQIQPNSSTTTTSSLIKLLFNKIDDSFFVFTGDYRKELMEGFIILKSKSNTLQVKIDQINNAINTFDVDALEENLVTYSYDYRNILRRIIGSASPIPSFDFYTSLETELIDNNGTTPATLNVKQTLKNANGLNSVTLSDKTHDDPFELVLFLNLSQQALLSDFSQPNADGKRSAAMVPVILTHYASEVGNQQTTQDLVQTSVDVGTLFIPGGQVNVLGKLFYYADKISSISSLAATYSGDANPELKNVFNKISLGTGLISLGDLANTGYKTLLKNNADNLKNLTPQQIATSLDDQATDIINIVNNHPIELNNILQLDGGADKIDELADVLEAEKLALGDAISTMQKQNIENAITALRSFSCPNCSSITSFNKLINNLSSSLDNTSLTTLSNNLDNQGFIRFDNNQYLFQSPKTFLNETGNSLYDLIIDSQYYVKYDLSDGRILLANAQNGEYYAFAQNLSPLILQSGDNVDDVIKAHLLIQSNKLKVLAGLTDNRSVNVLGQVINPSMSKTTTFIGRMEDINGLKTQLGDFKNIDLGENIGGINILNRPDAIWNSAGYEGWIINHNMPWVQRAVNRVDDVYLATSVDNLDNLMWTNFNGNSVPTISAYELRELVIGNLKPINITNQKWTEIQGVISQMETNNLFISY